MCRRKEIELVEPALRRVLSCVGAGFLIVKEIRPIHKPRTSIFINLLSSLLVIQGMASHDSCGLMAHSKVTLAIARPPVMASTRQLNS